MGVGVPWNYRRRLPSPEVVRKGEKQLRTAAGKTTELKPGRIRQWSLLSPKLVIFRLNTDDSGPFPSYEAGQYIALRRNDCLLTKKVKQGNKIHYVPDVDSNGLQKRGPVTHSFSIASAPFETRDGNYLEFYVVLVAGDQGAQGRFTESLFRVEKHGDDRLDYVERIVGDFTLAKRTAGFDHVLMVATGTGLAPFISIIKQLDFEARTQSRPSARYTLLHTNRTNKELGYHRSLQEIESSKTFDFMYVPSVSRPTERDRADSTLGIGRANNLLRQVFGMPASESSALAPQAPLDRPLEMLRERIIPARTVVLTCGNQEGMADIAWIAEQTGMRFEKEDW